jgi:hypothetical protein
MIWIYHKGAISAGMQIDHKDRIKDHNDINNLRLATNANNQWNVRKRSDSKVPYKGITYHKQSGIWQASIKVNKKFIFLGNHHTPEEAYERYKRAAAEFHGEYASV